MLVVNVTEFCRHLRRHLKNVQRGAKIQVALHGRVIARVLPPLDSKKEARRQLEALRKVCKIGNVVSPIRIT